MSLLKLNILFFAFVLVHLTYASDDPVDGNYDCKAHYRPQETNISECLLLHLLEGAAVC